MYLNVKCDVRSGRMQCNLTYLKKWYIVGMSHGDSENVRVPAPNGPPEGLRVSCRDHPLPAQHGCVTIGSQTNPSWLVTRSMENISRVSSLMFIVDANSRVGHTTHATRIRCLSSTSRAQVRTHGDTTHLIRMSCKYVNWYVRIPHVRSNYTGRLALPWSTFHCVSLCYAISCCISCLCST